METTSPQIYIFIITLYGGLVAGFVYDIYRYIRKAVNKGRWLTVLLDVLFIITLGLIVMGALFVANQGELRLFTFVGMALGFALYMAGLSLFFGFLAQKLSNYRQKRRTAKKD